MIGVDPAERAIAIARRHAAQQGLAIRYRVGSGEALPVSDRSMDYVVCVDVLEHVADLSRVIGEISRVLRPGGELLFDTINRTWISSLVLVGLGEYALRILPIGTHDPAKFITPPELAAQLLAYGFAFPQFAGLGPRGVNRKCDITFGALPSTSVMYMGSAIRIDADDG